ncbi:MAG: METTL5 family protein [archaeon]|nr:METTL5 family protein [archaeon]
MKKKDLEIALEKVRPFANPDPTLEQYPTPATIAADIVFNAYASGDIEGMKVLDLGCGTGMFSIAAALMGAGMVVGYDVSPSALEIAKCNAGTFGLDIDFRQSDVRAVEEGADTVLMNPPFGSQKRNADRPFLDKAMESAERVYSIHMANTLDFIKEYAEEKGRCVASYKIYKYVIPHTFSFHTKAKQTVEIAAVLIQ